MANDTLKLQIEIEKGNAEQSIEELKNSASSIEVDIDTVNAESNVEDLKEKVDELGESRELDLDTSEAEEKVDKLSNKIRAGLAAAASAAFDAFGKANDAQNRYEEHEAKRMGVQRGWGERAWGYTKTLFAETGKYAGTGALVGAPTGVGAGVGAVIGGVTGLAIGAGKVASQMWKDMESDDKIQEKENKRIMEESAKKRAEAEKKAEERRRAEEKAAKEKDKQEKLAAKEKEKKEKEQRREEEKAANERRRAEEKAENEKKKEEREAAKEKQKELNEQKKVIDKLSKLSTQLTNTLVNARADALTSTGRYGGYQSQAEIQLLHDMGGPDPTLQELQKQTEILNQIKDNTANGTYA